MGMYFTSWVVKIVNAGFVNVTLSSCVTLITTMCLKALPMCCQKCLGGAHPDPAAAWSSLLKILQDTLGENFVYKWDHIKEVLRGRLSCRHSILALKLTWMRLVCVFVFEWGSCGGICVCVCVRLRLSAEAEGTGWAPDVCVCVLCVRLRSGAEPASRVWRGVCGR